MFEPEALTSWTNDLVVQVTETNKEAGKAALVAKAISERNRVLLHGSPKPSGFRQFVNNVPDAPFETVTYDGYIILAWQYLQEVVRRCYEALVRSSPIFKGEYIDRIRVLINGEPASISDVDVNTTQVIIAASADYARRLEVGLRPDGSKFVLQVPLHNVELVAKMLRGKYKDLADISFGYVDLPDAWPLKHDFPSRRRQSHETHVRHPAITIVGLSAGSIPAIA